MYETPLPRVSPDSAEAEFNQGVMGEVFDDFLIESASIQHLK
jgi:hypothetical protein